MMKKIIISAIVLAIFVTLVSCVDGVKQKVIDNHSYDHGVISRIGEIDALIHSRNSDATIDSINWKRYLFLKEKNDNNAKKIYAPYKLITIYKYFEIVDYGTAKEIDSIKCIRYTEMMNRRANYDSLDEKLKLTKYNHEIELYQLNKSCN